MGKSFYSSSSSFFFHDTATTEIYTLSLHDALPIFAGLFASTTAIANAYVTETTSSANRSKGMGLIGAAFGLGLVFGPVIGGYFGGGDIDNINYKMPFIFAIIVAIVSFVLAHFILIEPKKRNKQFISINFLDSFKDLINLFKIPALLFLITVSFLVTFSFAGFETTFALWTERAMSWAPKQTGFAFTFTALLAALVQGVFIGKLTKSFGEIKLLITSCFLMSIGLFFISLSTQSLFAQEIITLKSEFLSFLGFETIYISLKFLILIIALGILGISVGLGNPSLNSLLSKNLNKGIIGTSFGVVQSVGSLARILSPLAMGNLFYFFGMNSPYNFGTFLMFISLLIFFYYFFFFQAEDGIRDRLVTGVQTCALPISYRPRKTSRQSSRKVNDSGRHSCDASHLSNHLSILYAVVVEQLEPQMLDRQLEIGRASCRERV